jgi:hypothetical protein
MQCQFWITDGSSRDMAAAGRATLHLCARGGGTKGCTHTHSRGPRPCVAASARRGTVITRMRSRG